MEWLFLWVIPLMKKGIVFDEKLVVYPPKPILKTEYYCDKVFHIESILPLYEESELCGLVWINGQDTSFYTVDLSNSDSSKMSDRSTRLKKHNKGGSSSARFGRLHEEAVIRYLKGIAEDMIQCFTDVKTIIVAGCGVRKDQIIPYLRSDISEKIIGSITVDGKETLSIVFSKMEEFYNIYQQNIEELRLKEFTDQINKDTNRAIYGKDIVQQALSDKSVKVLFSVRMTNCNCELVIIGKSRLAQELIQTYGTEFGISYY